MLLRLHIQQVALIDSLEIEFCPSMNILTGETGAGKSIIIDAVNLVLGERANKTLIRSGSDSAFVEAVFAVNEGSPAAKVLNELGLCAEDGQLIVSREVNQSGKNICRIAGKLVPLSALKQVSDCLMDVHGQHEHQALLNPSSHVDYLDRFAGASMKDAIAAIAAEYSNYNALKKRMNENYGSPDERLARLDFLDYRINEIKNAALYVGENQKLTDERDMLRNAQDITDSLNAGYDAMAGDEYNAMMCLKQVRDAMTRVSGYDGRYQSALTQLDEAYYTLEDISINIRDFRDSFEYDSDRLEMIEERLALIHNLERKYGTGIDNILGVLAGMEQEYDRLKNADEIVAEIKLSMDESRSVLETLCAEATSLRRAAAKTLSHLLEQQLADLGMPSARFDISIIEDVNHITSRGWDVVEFMLSANAGEPMKPLSKVASGGEMSRIMLALKSVGGNADDIPGMVFDEIDAGISGRIAEAVGVKLCGIARNRQVICVTHLPQIACLADRHFVVTKTESDGHTSVSLATLDRAGSIHEVARLAAGSNITETSLKHAEEMIEAGERLKSS